MNTPPNGAGPAQISITLTPTSATAWCTTCGDIQYGVDVESMAVRHLGANPRHVLVVTTVATVQRTLTVGVGG